MRSLIFALGTRGDVQPYVALGAALAARGHEVTISTGQGFDDLITAQGLHSAPLSIDYRALVAEPETRDALHSLRARLRLMRTAGPLVSRQLEEMWQIARDLDPALIVFHPKAYAARQIGEALKVPAIPAAVIPGFAPTADYPSPLLPMPSLGRLGNRLSHSLMLRLLAAGFAGRVKSWRRDRLGLEERLPRDLLKPYCPAGRALLRLHGFSRHLVSRPGDWPPCEVQTGYWFLDTARDWIPPEDLADFLAAGPAPLYIGFGSMPGENDVSMTHRVIQALEKTGQRAILATGWGGLAHVSNGGRIHTIEAAPHSWLLPRCAAAIHHGGAGTTHEALRWGRPSIVCPVFGDQPFWGHRVQAVGAGPKPLPQRRLTADSLARAIEDALSPATVASAAELGEALGSEAGAIGAAEAIEDALGV